MAPLLKLVLRILGLCILTVVGGFALYGIVYAPRFFKVLSILILVLGVYLLYLMIRHWLGEFASAKQTPNWDEAEVISEEERT